MNKISKKIVALATMAAFVLTLVPAAAFAANAAAPNASKYGVIGTDGKIVAEVTADVNDAVTTEFAVNDKGGIGTTEKLQGTDKDAGYVKVWAYDNANKEITDAAVFEGLKQVELSDGSKGDVWNFDPADTNAVKNGTEVKVTFTRPGSYTLYAGVGVYDKTGDDLTADLEKLQTGTTVVVPDPEVVADQLTFQNQYGGNLEVDQKAKVAELNLLNDDGFHFNGTQVYTLKGHAVQEDGTTPAAYTTFQVSTNKDSVIQFVKSEVVTDNLGNFEIQFRMHPADNANIYISNDDVDYTVRVIAEETEIADIETVEDGGYVLAGTDDNWTDAARWFNNAVKYEITDKNGEVITTDTAISEEPMYDSTVALHDRYVTILDKPKKSELTANDLAVRAVGDKYTLYYNGAKGDTNGSTNIVAKKLIPGKYTVRIALSNDEYADATFTVAEFGTVQELALDLYATDVNDNALKNVYPIDDEITLGQKVVAVATYVDENGLKVPATSVQYGFKGDPKVYSVINAKDGRANLVADELENEVLLGTVITVQAFDADAHKFVEKEVTVVDSYSPYSLAFDPTEGEANVDNRVTVSVVDEDGDVARVDGSLSAYIADQSNKDAKVSIDYTNSATAVDNGKGTLTIFSDKETTVDIVVAVDTVDGPIYAGTLEYTIGAEPVNADRTVVMTIGSTDYVVNNSIVTGDAAPYIDSAWRTMVPFRVLGESFGATVDWDQDAQSVTYVIGNTELVMTIGEETYTINGEEFNMDTAPVLSGDRTYVPVRFVAEGLGFTVTPLYDTETGLTASVVFQK